MRVNQEHAFVIGGYTVGPKTFDALVFGYYEGDNANAGDLFALSASSAAGKKMSRSHASRRR